MPEFIRSYIEYTFHSLSKYDYLAIGWVLFLSILLIILAIFIKRKSLSYTILFLGIFLLFLAPPAIKIAMDHYIRACDVHVTTQKALRFSHALVVNGTLTNKGKIDFSKCDIVILALKPSKNLLTAITSYLKPINVHIEHEKEPILRNETKPFKILVDPFFAHEFNLTVTARCYP